MQNQPVSISTFFTTTYARGPQRLDPSILLERVIGNFHLAIPGYRDGVILVPISPHDLLSTVVELDPADKLLAFYESRVEGELPRKEILVLRDRLPDATRADVVLYRKDVLAETDERSSDADWEIITLLAHSGDIPLPLHPDTFAYNHFKLSGGTATGLSPEEFTAQFEISFKFWSNKAVARLSSSAPGSDS